MHQGLSPSCRSWGKVDAGRRTINQCGVGQRGGARIGGYGNGHLRPRDRVASAIVERAKRRRAKGDRAIVAGNACGDLATGQVAARASNRSAVTDVGRGHREHEIVDVRVVGSIRASADADVDELRNGHGKVEVSTRRQRASSASHKPRLCLGSGRKDAAAAIIAAEKYSLVVTIWSPVLITMRSNDRAAAYGRLMVNFWFRLFLVPWIYSENIPWLRG